MCFLVFRAARGLVVLGFLMVPGLMVLHLWGICAAVAVVALGVLLAAIHLVWRAWHTQTSIGPVLTSECRMGWELHPAITVSAGLPNPPVQIDGVRVPLLREVFVPARTISRRKSRMSPFFPFSRGYPADRAVGSWNSEACSIWSCDAPTRTVRTS